MTTPKNGKLPHPRQPQPTPSIFGPVPLKRQLRPLILTIKEIGKLFGKLKKDKENNP